MILSERKILFAGLAAHLAAGIFTIGVHHADELYQVFEFAGYKLGLNTADILPWEFHERMRSGIQPLIVFILTKVLAMIGITNPFQVASFARIFMSLFAFVAALGLIRLLSRELKSPAFQKTLWLLGLMYWLLPYFHARFSSENFSSVLFIGGLFLLLHPKFENRLPAAWFAGLLFGLAFCVRFQMSFMIAGLMLWLLFIRKTSWRNVLLIVTGILLAIGLNLLADRWLYGQWTLSWWNYLDANFFQDKASHFGTQPFYFFLTEGLLQLLPPFSLLVIAAVFGFWIFFPKHYLTWITLPFIVLHFFVGHKEIRFLMPVLNFIPFMVLLFIEQGLAEQRKVRKFLLHPGMIRFALIVNFTAMIFMCLKPADQSTLALKNIYDHVTGEKPVLYYNGNDPYDMFSLNYFRNTSIQTEPHDVDPKVIQSDNLYYFSEEEKQPLVMVHRNRAYYRIYSNFPDWITYLDFNGWVGRAGRYSIYKVVLKGSFNEQK